MNPKTQPTILLVGNDVSLSYLLGRFAEQSGYQLIANTGGLAVGEIAAVKPAVIIFLSTELLAKDHALITELASLDTPIMVCSSVAEEARARELGADYCLFHPLTYNDFQTTLAHATASKRV